MKHHHWKSSKKSKKKYFRNDLVCGDSLEKPRGMFYYFFIYTIAHFSFIYNHFELTTIQLLIHDFLARAPNRCAKVTSCVTDEIDFITIKKYIYIQKGKVPRIFANIRGCPPPLKRWMGPWKEEISAISYENLISIAFHAIVQGFFWIL